MNARHEDLQILGTAGKTEDVYVQCEKQGLLGYTIAILLVNTWISLRSFSSNERLLLHKEDTVGILSDIST